MCLTLLLRVVCAVATPLSQEEIGRGIAFGKLFQNRKEFIQRGLKNNKVQLSSAFARDSTSKYVTFYEDYEIVAARVVQAQQQLREISEQDLEQVPQTGLLFAYLELHARGALPIRRLNRRYTAGGTHMVLQIDGVNIQPSREGFIPAPEQRTCMGQYYSFSAFAIYNFTVGNGGWKQLSWDCTEEKDRYSAEFGFQLSPEQRKKTVIVLVVNSEGERFGADVDLSKIK